MSRKRATLVELHRDGEVNDIIDEKSYKDIWKCFAKKLIHSLIFEGLCYKLPHRLGTFQIMKKQTKREKRMIDFNATRKHGVTIYHNNKHSDGYYVLMHWNKDYPIGCFVNKKLFKLKLTRHNSRYLSSSVKEHNTINKYFEFY